MGSASATPIVGERIVAFGDLSNYHRQISSKLSPEETFLFLSEYYSMARQSLDGSSGRIVKFIGDAILIVFPPRDPNDAILALRELKTAIDAFLSQSHHDSRFCVKAHIGMIAAGLIGTGELERFDICGIAVNHAALLPNGEWVLSDELRTITKA
jgi:class 3 adenylate cyclase